MKDQKKYLVGICTIDRDWQKLPYLYSCTENQKPKVDFDYIIVTRKQDVKIQEECKKFKNCTVVLINNYTIKKHHNLEKLVEKRTIILNYAKEKKYDLLWCLDSDILPYEDTFSLLREKEGDAIGASYKVRWSGLDNLGIMGKFGIKKITLNDLKETDEIFIIGFGCLLLKPSCFETKIEIQELMNNGSLYFGEDIGFCLNLKKNKLKINVLSHPVRHFCEQSCPIQ